MSSMTQSTVSLIHDVNSNIEYHKNDTVGYHAMVLMKKVVRRTLNVAFNQ